MRWSNLFLCAFLLWPSVACYEPKIVGLIVPDEDCSFSTDGDVRDDGVLDVGPIEALTHSYEAVLLVQGLAGNEVTEATVAFSEADNGDRLDDTEYDGRTVVFPSVEGERISKVKGTIEDDGFGEVPFTLVTEDEAAPLQNLTEVGEDFEMRVEIKATVDGIEMDAPYWAVLRICKTCLVGVGGTVEDGAIVCDDGSTPVIVDEAPCREGQDEIFSVCEGAD